jgi:hypothetical protein
MVSEAARPKPPSERGPHPPVASAGRVVCVGPTVYSFPGTAGSKVNSCVALKSEIGAVRTPSGVTA